MDCINKPPEWGCNMLLTIQESVQTDDISIAPKADIPKESI